MLIIMTCMLLLVAEPNAAMEASSLAGEQRPAVLSVQQSNALKLAVSQSQLTASDGAADDNFGIAVSLSGDKALIGAYLDDNGSVSGAAYVFEYDGTNWHESQKLTASDGANIDWFGIAVSLSGNRALIGAALTDDNGFDSGAAYVFEFDGINWSETQKLSASDGEAFDLFGYSVSLAGDRALIGAYQDNDNGSSSGSAYVFEFDGTSWNESQKLTASDGAIGDRFGIATNLSAERALIGAYEDSDNGPRSGSAYVYEFDGASWNESQKLTASDGASGDRFGYAISLSGDRALIGAYQDTDNGISSGSAYIYDFNGAVWSESQKLIASDGAGFEFFGKSLSLSADRALIGAYADDHDGPFSGSAYLFELDGQDWIEVSKFTATDGAINGRFGNSISLAGNQALIGANTDDGNDLSSGAAYIINLGVINSIPVNMFHPLGLLFLILFFLIVIHWQKRATK